MTDNTRLTKKQINALKKADAICFDYMKEGLSYTSSTLSGVRAIKRANDNNPFEQTIAIPCLSYTHSFKTDYSENGNRTEVHKGYFHFGSAQYTEELMTFVSFLREGDQIKLLWQANNNTQTLDELGLHHDELRAVIMRPTKSGKDKLLTFLIDSSVCKNNSARSIKAY